MAHRLVHFFKENTTGVVIEMGPKPPGGGLESNPTDIRHMHPLRPPRPPCAYIIPPITVFPGRI